MLIFNGAKKTNDGLLCVIGLAAGVAPPAGSIVIDGIARHPDGSVYVVFA